MRWHITGMVLAGLAFAPAAEAATDVELIVRRDAGMTSAERVEMRAEADVDYVRSLRLSRTELVEVDASDARDAIATLRDNPDVQWVARNGVVKANQAPNDPLFGSQWGLNNTGQTVLGAAATPDADIDAPEAWELGDGTGTTVAIVDSGIVRDHVDLAGRLAINPGESGGGRETNKVDDDGDGLVDDVSGWDFIGADNSPDDGTGHGTMVSGIVAAATGNGRGVAGVAPGAKLLPLRVFGDKNESTWAVVLDALDYAGDRGAQVVNASLGGAGGPTEALAAIIGAHPGSLYVVSAGNSAKDLDADDGSAPVVPCQVPRDNVLCVGASTAFEDVASWSNRGRTSVDLFAPGQQVLTTYLGGKYAYAAGTSFAAPMAAGVAALVHGARPDLDASGVRAAVLAVDRLPVYAGLSVSGGRLNARSALQAALLEPEATPEPTPGATPDA